MNPHEHLSVDKFLETVEHRDGDDVRRWQEEHGFTKRQVINQLHWEAKEGTALPVQADPDSTVIEAGNSFPSLSANVRNDDADLPPGVSAPFLDTSDAEETGMPPLTASERDDESDDTPPGVFCPFC